MAASTHSQRVWETVLLTENSPVVNSLITTRYNEILSRQYVAAALLFFCLS